MTRTARVVFVSFFLSGATSLVYQVVWARALALIFGHSMYAIAAVLVAFMAGLALGSAVFARRAARIGNPLRAYGMLEIGIGVYCACVPFLLSAGGQTYFGIQRALDLSYEGLSVVQFVGVVLLLLVPTALMGGTLPVLSQALAAGANRPGRTVGALYAVNTAGAVTGVVMAGYVLLPMFGNRATTFLAAAANLAVGGLALMWSRRPLETPTPSAEPATNLAGEPGPSLPVVLTLLALGASGAVSMAYEIAWTRALTLVIGSSTYAFTAVLTAFLVGIAGGSAVYSRWAGARPASPTTFAAIQVGIALTVTLTLLVFERVPEFFLAGLGVSDLPGFVQSLQVAVSLVTLLASTLLIGATLPCAVAVATRRGADIARHTGRAYAINTAGAIAGILLTGFGLVPWYGVHAALKIGAATNLVLAGVLAVAAAPRGARRGWAAAAAGAVGAVAILCIPVWDARVMVSGPAIYGKAYVVAGRSAPMGSVLRTQEVLFYRDGMSGTVSVNRVGANVILRVNGKADAATIGDTTTQLMLGHLPMLMHADPRQVLVIGMGSGITAGAVARHPMERLDIVEIEPAVLEASAFFAEANRHVLRDPRVHPVVADGRNFLFTTARRYDVISSEPSNPWIGGLASLFSEEFFRAAQGRLRPGGIMIQWIHGYSMRDADLRMVVNTFRSVFPSTSVWNTGEGDYLLVGRTEAVALDLHLLETRYRDLPGLATDMRGLDIMSWGGMLGFFMLSDADTARYAAGGGLNTDDRLPLEFSAPRAMYLDSDVQNWRTMRSFQTSALPALTAGSRAETDRVEVRYAIGMAYLGRDVPGDALVHFVRALEIDPRHIPSALGAGRSDLRLGRWAAALAQADGVLAREPRNSAALFVAAVATARLDRPDEALVILRQAVALAPDDAEFARSLQALEAAMAAARRKP